MVQTRLTASRFTARALSPATAQRLQAAANTFIPMRKGEKSDAVKVLQRALIDLGDDRFNTAGPTGFYDQETYEVVFKFQDAYHLQKDGEVGGETLGKLQELYATPGAAAGGGGGAGGGSVGPTHQDVIDRAFARSRQSVHVVLDTLLRLEAAIDRASTANGINKIAALATLGRIHARDIAVLSLRLKVNSNPLSAEFGDALAKARSLVQQNLSASSAIIDQGDLGRCAPENNNSGGIPFAATRADEPDPRVSVCTPFFAQNDVLQRDIITHEFFHLVGCADVEGPANTADFLNNAHTMAMVVSFINDRFRQANALGGEVPNPPLPMP